MRNSLLQVFQLGSGSSGNLTALRTKQGVILIDAGFYGRECLRRLKAVGIDKREIFAIIVTHAHNDHARGAALLSRRLKIPIFGTPWTISNLTNIKGKEILEPIPEKGKMRISNISIETYPSPHDIPGTVILKINEKLGIATDLGCITEELGEFLSGLDGLLLEFNHDMNMLINGPYPGWLKQRILADTGHLSNKQAGDLLRKKWFYPPKKALWLCHLSQENNTKELALKEAQSALENKKPLEIIVTSQDEPSIVVTI